MDSVVATLGNSPKMRHDAPVEYLVSTTNSVRLSFLLGLLRDAGMKARVFDANISALEAGIGAFPRRIMVPTKLLLAAKTLLEDANEFYDD